MNYVPLRTQYFFDLSGIKYKSRNEVNTLRDQWNIFERVENYNDIVYQRLSRGDKGVLFYQFADREEMIKYRRGQLQHISRYPWLSSSTFVSISTQPLPAVATVVPTPTYIRSVPLGGNAMLSSEYATQQNEANIYRHVSTYNATHAYKYAFTNQEEQLAYTRFAQRVCHLSSSQTTLPPLPPHIPNSTMPPTTTRPPGTSTTRPLGTSTTLPLGTSTTLPPEPEPEPEPQADTTLPPEPGSDTTLPPGSGTTLPPGSGTTLPPGSDTTLPPGSDTTLPPDTSTTLPPDNSTTLPPDNGTTLPPDTTTTLPPETTTTLPPDTSTTLPPEVTTTLPPNTTTTLPPGTDTTFSVTTLPVTTLPLPIGTTTTQAPVVLMDSSDSSEDEKVVSNTTCSVGIVNPAMSVGNAATAETVEEFLSSLGI